MGHVHSVIQTHLGVSVLVGPGQPGSHQAVERPFILSGTPVYPPFSLGSEPKPRLSVYSNLPLSPLHFQVCTAQASGLIVYYRNFSKDPSILLLKHCRQCVCFVFDPAASSKSGHGQYSHLICAIEIKALHQTYSWQSMLTLPPLGDPASSAGRCSPLSQ